MAFFRNFQNDTVSHSVMEDKVQGQNANRVYRLVGNECADATSSEKDFDMNMEAQYQSDGEPDGASRLQNKATTDDGAVTRESNLQTAGSKTTVLGRWGSTFWKDCQPMRPQNGFESGHESKSGSDYRNEDGSEGNSLDGRWERLDSEDDNEQKEAGKGPGGHPDVPAEEMLSDEYYEQDGEEQRHSLHQRGIHQPTGSNSWPQKVSTIVHRNSNKKSRISDDVEDDGDDSNDDDGDADYEEEDEADEDDPDDADFEPATSVHAANKDKDWEGEGSYEDDDSDENVDVSVIGFVDLFLKLCYKMSVSVVVAFMTEIWIFPTLTLLKDYKVFMYSGYNMCVKCRALFKIYSIIPVKGYLLVQKDFWPELSYYHPIYMRMARWWNVTIA